MELEQLTYEDEEDIIAPPESKPSNRTVEIPEIFVPGEDDEYIVQLPQVLPERKRQSDMDETDYEYLTTEEQEPRSSYVHPSETEEMVEASSSSDISTGRYCFSSKSGHLQKKYNELSFAVHYHQKEKMEKILNDAEPNTLVKLLTRPDKNGRPCIMQAISRQSVNCIRPLLEKLKTLNFDSFGMKRMQALQSQSDKKNILHVAAKMVQLDEEILNAINIDLIMKELANSEDSSGTTPLIVACQYRNHVVAQKLVNAKAKIDHVDRGNNSPIYFAAAKGSDETLKLLLHDGGFILLRHNMADITQTTLTISILLEKAHRAQYMNKIKKYVCALLNSSGGTLILKAQACQADENIVDEGGLKSDDVIRAVEQAFHPVIGTACVSSHLSITSETSAEIVLNVQDFKSLCTLNYNMFLPTDTQVLPIKCDELATVVDLMNINRFIDITDFDQNARPVDEFVHNSVFPLKESKTVQLKCLSSEKTKYNDLGSRIINNKFTTYVSAFANSVGGWIYFGIDDKTRRVVGETITEDEQKDLEKKLKKYIENMLWPEYCTPPVKGKQWDISFHAVIDNAGRPVQYLYVIVVTIHAQPGGVFVKAPESYHIVPIRAEESENSEILENEVQPMDFTEWKRRLLYPEDQRDIPRTLSRCDWSSTGLKEQCDELDGKLLRLINYGKGPDFEREAEKHRPKENDPNRIEIELVLLSKWYVYYYRRGKNGDFKSADDVMMEFKGKCCKAKDNLLFQIRGRLCLSALQRTRGYHEESYKTARDCLSDVETLSPCILTAEFYVHFATMLTIIEGNEVLRRKLKGDLSQNSFKEEAMVFYNRALEHLRRITYVPSSRADMQQKSHINMAILLLDCSLSGDVVDKTVSKEAIEAASTCLKRVDESIVQDGNSLSHFRSCHHKFATSSLHYRRSQHEKEADKREGLLDSAIRAAGEVKFLATSNSFPELSKYACKHIQVYTKELEQLQAKT